MNYVGEENRNSEVDKNGVGVKIEFERGATILEIDLGSIVCPLPCLGADSGKVNSST